MDQTCDLPLGFLHFVNLAACLPVTGRKLDCFYIALFWGMVVYIDEFEMKECKINWNPKNTLRTTVGDQNTVKKYNISCNNNNFYHLKMKVMPVTKETWID